MNAPESQEEPLAVNPSDISLDQLLKQLRLANTRCRWRELVERAEREDWSCRDFLAVVVAE